MINGTALVSWLVFALFALLSIVLLSGHGENLIAGYNTSSAEEKDKYDKRKLCRVTGAGMAVISVLLLVMAIWTASLPSWFYLVFLAVVIIDSIVMIVLANTVCKR